jgi:hypothetical protein
MPANSLAGVVTIPGNVSYWHAHLPKDNLGIIDPHIFLLEESMISIPMIYSLIYGMPIYKSILFKFDLDDQRGFLKTPEIL